jgi:hypothetical protein
MGIGSLGAFSLYTPPLDPLTDIRSTLYVCALVGYLVIFNCRLVGVLHGMPDRRVKFVTGRINFATRLSTGARFQLSSLHFVRLNLDSDDHDAILYSCCTRTGTRYRYTRCTRTHVLYLSCT